MRGAYTHYFGGRQRFHTSSRRADAPSSADASTRRSRTPGAAISALQNSLVIHGQEP